MEGPVVGRDAELSILSRFLDGIESGPAQTAVIAGPAGMGKSTLWRAAVVDARARGIRVLDARPAEVEATLAYAGLHDLTRDIHPTAFGGLPPPQRRALETALYRGQIDTGAGPTGGAPESAVIAIAVLSLIRSLAAEGPLLVAVDDLQWLDRSSLEPLRFMVRRLDGLSVGVLVAVRASDPAGADAISGLESPAGRPQRIDLGPLSLGALHRLIGERSGVSLPRPGLVHLQELAGGNPYMALELIRELGSDAITSLRREHRLPATMDGLLIGRVAVLTPSERWVAQAVAAIGRPTDSLLARVLAEIPQLESITDNAIDAGVLRRESDRLRCSHPLLASALLEAMSPRSRGALHARIAHELDDPLERAPHLAAAADGPDAAVATALDQAAVAAAQRGAPVEGIGLRQQALEMTPPSDGAAIARRRVALADAVFTAGDTGRARRELELLGVQDLDLDVMLEARLLLATIMWFDDDSEAAVLVAEEALAAAGDDGAWRARIHARLSWMLDYDLSRQAAHGAAAVALLDAGSDPVSYAFGVLNQAWARLLAGEGADHAAIELGERLQRDALSWEYSSIPASWAKAMDQHDLARQRLDRYIERSRQSGDESSVAQLLSVLAELECWVGDVDRALSLADEAVAIAEQTGQNVFMAISLARRAVVRAYRGDLARARLDAERGLGLSSPPLLPPAALGALGFICLSEGDPAGAERHLSAADAMLEGIGMREPAPYRFHGDLMEALIQTGALDRAAEMSRRLEWRAGVVPRPWIEAIAARTRGLLLAAHGDLAEAVVAFEAALQAHARLGMPLETARTLLAHGVLLRRMGRRQRASEQLSAALAGFERLGCGPWAARARDELARVGYQRTDDGRLTPSEERIARLAASGLTNRVISERLVISPKTVEASLARAYLKLGIHSRAELGAVMAGTPEQPDPDRGVSGT